MKPFISTAMRTGGCSTSTDEVFIGIFLFVFTFITSGMSLVTERMGGTMTRFLATPVNAGQILLSLLLRASLIILWVALTFIGFPAKAIWDSWYSPASLWLWYR